MESAILQPEIVYYSISIMQAVKYIQYFFYLAYNWNIRIAWHIVGKEIKGEKKYGIKTTGSDELKSLEKKGIDISHATIFMSASYDLLEDIFEKLRGQKHTHFIDIGCGKGRPMCVAAHYNFKKLTGIDFSRELCRAATENLLLTKRKQPGISYEVINNDAFYYEIPVDADCLFLFNPFDETIMSGVIRNIDKSLRDFPRDMHIIYLNPLHKRLFISKGYKEIYSTKKLNYLEGCILLKKKR